MTLPREEVVYLEDFLYGITDEEILGIRGDVKRLKEFCRDLIRLPTNPDNEMRQLKKLREDIRLLSLNSKELRGLVERWIPIRERLLESLKRKATMASIVTKLCSGTIFLSSVMDSAGLIGNQFVKKTNPLVATALTAFKYGAPVSMLSYAAQHFLCETIFGNIQEEITEDENHITIIRAWFAQNEELEKAVKSVFPMRLIPLIVESFERSTQKDLNSIDSLQTIIQLLLSSDDKQLKNVQFFINLVELMKSPEARDVLKWFFFKDSFRREAFLKISVKLSSLITVSCLTASSATLPVAQPIVEGGRLLLNLKSMTDAFATFKNDEMAEEIRKLERSLRNELNAFSRIVEEFPVPNNSINLMLEA